MSEKFDIYSKIFYRNVEKFVRYLCVLVLRHQMRVSNYFVNSFYSVASRYKSYVNFELQFLNSEQATLLIFCHNSHYLRG
jgi:hypothetical protein